jgi:predicted short-subunit dehydrogenase-like oxidoreductase (DUF2520 family)
MISVSIIGVGRVGGALSIALDKTKYKIENLIQRGRFHSGNDNIEPGGAAPAKTTLEELSEVSSDIIFITTPDFEIKNVARELAVRVRNKPFVFHTSGSLSSSVLDCLGEIGCKTGSMHPLVSISAPELGIERFRGAYFCLEGDADAVRMADGIAKGLGGIPFSIDTKFKTLYHASAVTACGHLVALFDAAVEMMTHCGLSDAESKKILLPLVKSTVQNLDEQTTAAALTGTFARADSETFTKHLQALNENVSDELLEIYLLLGERSLELAARQGVSAEKIETLRTKVSIAKTKLKW